MRLQKFRHSCLLVETADARLLFDPGVFSEGFEELEGLTAVLVTHQHPDHLDRDRLPRLLERNPQARLISDEGSGDVLRELGLDPAAVTAGDVLDLGCDVQVGGGRHAEIHPDIPRISNVGYLVDGRLWHPGDALVAPDSDVEILALPVVAPWMKIAETIDFYRSVAPRTAVPIHDAISAVPELYCGMLDGHGPQGSVLRRFAGTDPLEL